MEKKNAGSIFSWVYRGDIDATGVALDYAVETAKKTKVVYISASKEKVDLEKYAHTEAEAYKNIDVDDTPAPAIEDILINLENSLHQYEIVHCVINCFPLLSAKKADINFRKDEIVYIFEKINQFVLHHNVHFLLLLPVSRYRAKESTIERELGCYGSIGMFGDRYIEIKKGIPFEYRDREYVVTYD